MKCKYQYLYSIALLVIVFSCSSKPVKKEPFPFIEVAENEWAVYEGNIMTEEGLETEIELSLRENTVGVDSDYKLNGIALTENDAIFNLSHGKFSVAYGLADHAMGIELKARNTGRLMSSVKITHAKYPKKVVKHGAVESQNVYFRTNGNEQLIFADDDFTPVAQDARFTLYKRSELFTAEGYLTVEEDGEAEFFERNTAKNWKVAKLGRYTEIETNYKKLATLPMEGIYLRALAYSVADTTAVGEPIRKLVVKRVLVMNASH